MRNHVNKKRSVIIDGHFLALKYSGTHRFAIEIIKELDKCVTDSSYELVVPNDVNLEEFNELSSVKNIKFYSVGNYKGKRISWFVKEWLHILKEDSVHVELCDGFPMCSHSIIALHDIYSFFNMHGCSWWFNLKKQVKAYLDALFARKIITVSEYSKRTILEKLPAKDAKITVIYNSWEHIKAEYIETDILDRFNLKSGCYYFFLGRLAKNKNLKWIFEEADYNPDDMFVIAGSLWKDKFSYYHGKYNNIVYTGFVSEKDLPTLYKNCKAFLFPSLMEGFGIPPMEALYYNAPIIISNTSSLPEIYGNAAHYIDPYKYTYNLDLLLSESVAGAKSVLDRFSWSTSAHKLYSLIESER